MNDTQRIPTNLRTLMILEVIGRSDRAMTPTEINAHIGLPKQTVHRLCKTLETEGFLSRDLNGKRLRPSRRLRLLGAGLLHATQTHIARHQVLLDVAADVKEAVNFVVPEETGMHYIDRIDTDWPLRIQLPVGSNVPFHCTASGKVFMASMPPEDRLKFVSALKLEKLTRNSHTDADLLLKDLEAIALKGFALDNEEFMDGMVAIAVPVTDKNNRFVAALAFHGPTQRITAKDAIAKKDFLIDGANSLRTVIFS
jgi:DNA-binding IclR family transcriptional regulator